MVDIETTAGYENDGIFDVAILVMVDIETDRRGRAGSNVQRSRNPCYGGY